MHLNKLVVKDFGKHTTLLNEYNKYLILNIFYNRRKELKFLEKLLKKQDKKNVIVIHDLFAHLKDIGYGDELSNFKYKSIQMIAISIKKRQKCDTQ